jgi:hypothetical protein
MQFQVTLLNSHIYVNIYNIVFKTKHKSYIAQWFAPTYLKWKNMVLSWRYIKSYTGVEVELRSFLM